MLAWIRTGPLREAMVSAEDVELLHVTDDPADAVELVVDSYERRRAHTPAAALKEDAH
jgi:predicted Rossmann-fold nucleotide-binding protein